MDIKDLQEVTSGYSERIARIALFDPLNELGRKKQEDQAGNSIDFKGLGLLTLLFFFEQKLMRSQRTGVKDLVAFLQKVSESTIQMDLDGYEEVARTIVQTFRPTSGKKREFPFFNWETKQDDKVYYSILKANSFDLKTNTQYYTLDEDGLELVFATKEFYSEFQLSINQLVLRKQLEKGEFKGALRQINEMHIDVESLQERMIKLEHEIKRNIVSEETFNRYQSLLDDVYYRLHRENEEFEELHTFVKETKDRLYYQDHDKKESKTYALVLQISKELENVHAEHTHLLQQSVDLKTKALRAAQESLYYVGIDSFNFDQDITARIISSPLPLQSLKGILSPFLQIQETRQWSLLTVFAQQNVAEERNQQSDDSFLEIGNELEKIRYQEIQRKNYAKLMSLLIQAIEEKRSIQLEQFVDFLKINGQGHLVDQRFFYDFWILLHQRSPLSSTEDQTDDEETNHVLDGVLSQLGSRILKVTEHNQILHVTDRYSIQNMTIDVGENADAV